MRRLPPKFRRWHKLYCLKINPGYQTPPLNSACNISENFLKISPGYETPPLNSACNISEHCLKISPKYETNPSNIQVARSLDTVSELVQDIRRPHKFSL